MDEYPSVTILLEELLPTDATLVMIFLVVKLDSARMMAHGPEMHQCVNFKVSVMSIIECNLYNRLFLYKIMQLCAQICLLLLMEGLNREGINREILQPIPATPTMSFLVIAQEPVKMMDHGLEVLQLVLELSAPIFQIQAMDKSPSPLVFL